MIGNIPGSGRDFQSLCRYLVEGPGGSSPELHRVAWTMTRNLATDDIMLAAKIMTATADLSVRTRKPVYHCILSWNGSEQPSRAAMEQVVADVLAEMGLAGHQAVVVAHGDTANPHVHMAVNRVHADTGTAWCTKQDFRRLERCAFRLALEHGFIAVPGRHNRAEPDLAPRRLRARGAMMMARKDKAALKPWTRKQVATLVPRLSAVFREAASWAELTRGLEACGHVLEAKGQGFIVRDRASTGYVKLSGVGAGLGRLALEKRFGAPFRGSDGMTPIDRRPSAAPVVRSPAQADTDPSPELTP